MGERAALGPLWRGTWWGGTLPGRMSYRGTSPCCGAVRAGTAAVPPSSAASRPLSSPQLTVSSKEMLGGSFLYYWFYCDERNPTTFYRPTHKYLTLGSSQVISLTLLIATPQYNTVTCQEKDLYCKIRIFWQISDNNLPFTTAPITSLTGRLGPRTSSLASARTSWLLAGPPRWPLPS